MSDPSDVGAWSLTRPVAVRAGKDRYAAFNTCLSRTVAAQTGREHTNEE
ncbi:hypothetical protein KIF24_25925 [Micromonospora sp. Llam7]|nr:hypothetical protein [Micromonospora tarapacensis]MBX7269122.1 hypothetical protein [Micromonospora tarapacensis]